MSMRWMRMGVKDGDGFGRGRGSGTKSCGWGDVLRLLLDNGLALG